jgi:hypothetical protein
LAGNYAEKSPAGRGIWLAELYTVEDVKEFATEVQGNEIASCTCTSMFGFTILLNPGLVTVAL